MDGDEVALADELVEFDIVDVTPDAGLRRVQYQEQVVVISMNLGYLIAVRGVTDCERMEPKCRPQRLLGLFIPFRYVDPHQPVGSGQQGGQVGRVA